MNKVGDEKNYPPLAKNQFLGKKVGGGAPPQISQKFNLVWLSSNFQDRPGQINEQGWRWKILPPFGQKSNFKAKRGGGVSPQISQNFNLVWLS